jgi:hypothetical protein
MLKPFPELTHLGLGSLGTLTVLPDSFLGGSAPRLQFLWLSYIPFPGLPKLLLSATHLIEIHLRGIPHSGYISPEAIVTALSTLTAIRSLSLGFESPRSFPDRESRRPPPTHSAFPYFSFKGVGEYLDDLLPRIDAPRLQYLVITFFNQIVFDTPHCMLDRIDRLRKISSDSPKNQIRGAQLCCQCFFFRCYQQSAVHAYYKCLLQ